MKHAWDLRFGKLVIDVLPNYCERYYGYFKKILVVVLCTRGGKMVMYILGVRSERNSVMILQSQFYLVYYCWENKIFNEKRNSVHRKNGRISIVEREYRNRDWFLRH